MRLVALPGSPVGPGLIIRSPARAHNMYAVPCRGYARRYAPFIDHNDGRDYREERDVDWLLKAAGRFGLVHNSLLVCCVILSQRVRGRVAGPTIVLLLLMSLSCGGSGNNVASAGGGGAGGTPSGTFTLTFKATSGSLIRSTTVSLAIN